MREHVLKRGENVMLGKKANVKRCSYVLMGGGLPHW